MFRNYSDVTRPALSEQNNRETCINRIYMCDFCSDGWSSETEVEIHRSNNHRTLIADMLKDQNKFICKMCMTEFSDNDILLQHIKSVHLLSSSNAIRVERDIFICNDCGDIFFNKLLLVHHILHLHSPKRNYTFKCPRCLKNIRMLTCWYHFLLHKLQSVAVCKICLMKFKDRLLLAKHLKTHPYNYRCETCAYTTKKGEMFDKHIQNKHKKPGINVNTTINWSKYYVPHRPVRNRMWHRINLMGWKGVKLTNNIHICILCREICVDFESMKQHILVNHMDEQKTKTDFQCSCGLVFTSKVLHKHHMFKFKDLHNI